MTEENADIQNLENMTSGEIYEAINIAKSHLSEANYPDPNSSLVAGLKEEPQPVVLDVGKVKPPGNTKAALREIQQAEEEQRRLREQYERDRNFFEGQVLKKARSVGEIQEDYIKVLHPEYREKFINGIAQYGTVAASMKLMKMTYGIKLRGDVLRRMTALIPGFKQEIDDALEEYQATLQMEMHRRAVEGIDKGIYHQGELVATEKVYSDNLLSKMVDTHNPEYKEAKQKESSRGNTINVQIIKDFHNYKDR